MERNGFVCAINGSRDGYQVPAALHQAGLLRRFVTDYYAPEQPMAWLPDMMKRRRSPLLPHAVRASIAVAVTAIRKRLVRKFPPNTI